MLKFLNKYKKAFIIVSFAYIYLLMILLVPSGYALTTPGEITSIDSNLYNIEGIDFTNDFNTISVYSWNELTVFQKWLVTKTDRYELYKQTPLQDQLSNSDLNKRGKISKEASHQLAIITAYENANKIDSNINIEYDFKGLVVYTNFGKYANIGSLVVGVNDLSLIDNPNLTYEELYFETLEVIGDDLYQRKQTLKITLDNGESIDVNYENNEYMSFYPQFEIKKTTPTYYEELDKRNVGGPSGGMMQALAIYTALLNIDTNDKIIAGTGTIEIINNYRIGQIGGIVQKYYTAIDNNVDIMIIPSSQYHELKDHVDDDKIIIIDAKNFNELITKLALVK